MVLRENWSVSIERAEAFFAAQPDVTKTERGFLFRSCRICLREDTGKVGPWPIPRIVLHMEGPEEDVRAIHHRFFLRFLSAGG